MSIIEKLTEGIMSRDVQKEGQALLAKWEKTGLLEGIESDSGRSNMACLLENQAKELLREASSMAGGDVEGFAAVAFPIVRRVFGGLIANDVVSVQPMSLPSGLIFFLDFTVSATTPKPTIWNANDSIYGGGVVGQQVTGGVSLAQSGTLGPDNEKGPYNLNGAYASPTGSFFSDDGTTEDGLLIMGAHIIASGVLAAPPGYTQSALTSVKQRELDKLALYDADLSGTFVFVCEVTGGSALAQLNTNNLVSFAPTEIYPQGLSLQRRLTRISSGSTGNDPSAANWKLKFVVAASASAADAGWDDQNATNATVGSTVGEVLKTALTGAVKEYMFAIDDKFSNSTFGTPGGIVGATSWALESNAAIPEIDIKVDSVSITAMTKKLKAKWTPELQQDINAYHNLDAEVELTSILSEQIALEIDQEILGDLVSGAKAGTYYWSRKPGKFVDKTLGQSVNETLYPDFTGTVSEWYETLLETVNDVSAQIHRKTLRGGANFLVTSPEVANIMEFTSGFRADTTADEAKGTAGSVKVGSISKKWDVYVDPYFPRNVVLVGRKGGSFLESGYVYAPYVPLQVTPTIFGTEDFVPRKGVMTRYGKKMVRADMYGIVVVQDLLG